MSKLTMKQIMTGPNIFRSMYIYTLSVESLAAGNLASDTVNIENDAQFVWTKTSYSCDIAGAPQTENSRVIPLVNVQLVDSGSARQFFDEAQPLNSFAGHSGDPFVLPAPFIFDMNANISGRFENESAATTYRNLKISFHGFRVYEYSNKYS